MSSQCRYTVCSWQVVGGRRGGSRLSGQKKHTGIASDAEQLCVILFLAGRGREERGSEREGGVGNIFIGLVLDAEQLIVRKL